MRKDRAFNQIREIVFETHVNIHAEGSCLVKFGNTGSVSIYAPREHCNSQGVNDMGLTPEFLPGYQPSKGDKKNGLF